MIVNNFFNETFSRDEDDIKLYKFLKSNFQFCDIVYCDDKQHNIGFNYDGHRYFIRSCNGYIIADTARFDDSFFKSLNDVKEELIKIITFVIS